MQQQRLPAGSALPPSRTLAHDLGCSRWVVTEAYGQLVAEGYLESRVGAGTHVRVLESLHPEISPSAQPQFLRPARIDLGPGLPDLAHFPLRAWSAALQSAALRLSSGDLGFPSRAGHDDLLNVLAAYLTRVRGATAEASEVTICSGVADGIGRACRALQRAGFTAVAMEDPGWEELRACAYGADLEIIPIDVDDEGICVEKLDAHPAVRAVILSPAHQFPTGVALSSARRAKLLAWARRVDGLILEDDYDAEFRYDRSAISALQAAAPNRVALFGSVSKTLSPALRLGWMLTPPAWTSPIRAPESSIGTPPILDQLALAVLLSSGDYDRHVRRSRVRYRLRRDRLITALAHHVPAARVSGIAAGLHLVVTLDREINCRVAVEIAAARGLRLAHLGDFRMQKVDTGSALVLGYGNIVDEAVEPAVSVLASILDKPEVQDVTRPAATLEWIRER